MEAWEAVLTGIINCEALSIEERKLAAERYKKAYRENRISDGLLKCDASISASFVWSIQPEGTEYWSHLHSVIGSCKRFINLPFADSPFTSTFISNVNGFLINRKKIRDGVLGKISII